MPSRRQLYGRLMSCRVCDKPGGTLVKEREDDGFGATYVHPRCKAKPRVVYGKAPLPGSRATSPVLILPPSQLIVPKTFPPKGALNVRR